MENSCFLCPSGHSRAPILSSHFPDLGEPASKRKPTLRARKIPMELAASPQPAPAPPEAPARVSPQATPPSRRRPRPTMLQGPLRPRPIRALHLFLGLATAPPRPHPALAFHRPRPPTRGNFLGLAQATPTERSQARPGHALGALQPPPRPQPLFRSRPGHAPTHVRPRPLEHCPFLGPAPGLGRTKAALPTRSLTHSR